MNIVQFETVHAGNNHSNKSELSLLSPQKLVKRDDQAHNDRSDQTSMVEPHVLPRIIRRRFTGRQRREIHARVEAGETKQAIAKEFRVSETGIGEMLLNM